MAKERKLSKISFEEAVEVCKILHAPAFIAGGEWHKFDYSKYGIDGNGFRIVNPRNDFVFDFDEEISNVSLINSRLERYEEQAVSVLTGHQVVEYLKSIGIDLTKDTKQP